MVNIDFLFVDARAVQVKQASTLLNLASVSSCTSANQWGGQCKGNGTFERTFFIRNTIKSTGKTLNMAYTF